jgi:hypothetical protein
MEMTVKRHSRIEVNEARKVRLSTKIIPRFKGLRPISLKMQISLKMEKTTYAVYRDGDCRPDDTHDIWDRIRGN